MSHNELKSSLLDYLSSDATSPMIARRFNARNTDDETIGLDSAPNVILGYGFDREIAAALSELIREGAVDMCLCDPACCLVDGGMPAVPLLPEDADPMAVRTKHWAPVVFRADVEAVSQI